MTACINHKSLFKVKNSVEFPFVIKNYLEVTHGDVPQVFIKNS